MKHISWLEIAMMVIYAFIVYQIAGLQKALFAIACAVIGWYLAEFVRWVIWKVKK